MRLVEYVGYSPHEDEGPCNLDAVLQIIGCEELLLEQADASDLVIFKVVNPTPQS